LIKLYKNVLWVRFFETQSPLFEVCQVATVVIQTIQLFLSQFKNLVINTN